MTAHGSLRGANLTVERHAASLSGAAMAERPGGLEDVLYRKTSIAQCRAIAAAREAGVSPGELAVQYDISLRSVYRALEAAALPAVDVTVGAWHAEFVLADCGPIRVTPWHAVAT